MLRTRLESAVPPFHRPMLPLAVIGALLLALPLTGCGRKGALDPPPGGIVLEQRPGLTPTTQRSGGDAPQAYDEDGRPIAPAGPKRRIPPDWLLD
jgi:predicted small lipoprotein YifL